MSDEENCAARSDSDNNSTGSQRPGRLQPSEVGGDSSLCLRRILPNAISVAPSHLRKAHNGAYLPVRVLCKRSQTTRNRSTSALDLVFSYSYCAASWIRAAELLL